MNYCGLICEYNPFHTGHLFQLEEIKRLLPDTAIVCVMSGSFVQRAEPAVINKFIRTKIALENGADAVIQIPTAYTVCGGEKFSAASLAILSGIKNLKYLAFGCETTNFDLLKQLAEIRAAESDAFKNALRSHSKNGDSYPIALCKASLEVCKHTGLDTDECANILAGPNNILAIEYLKIIYKNNYNIEPVFIHRVGNYNSKMLTDKFTSATAIRAALLENETQKIADYIPYPPQILAENTVDYKLFDQLLLFSLRKAGAEKISCLADCAEGIENRLYQNVITCTDINIAFEKTKTKRYTYARLKRIAVQCLLDLTKDKVCPPPTSCGKLLGIRTELKACLSDFENIVVKHKDIQNTTNQNLLQTIETDRLADDIHSQLTRINAGNFFGSKLIEV